MDGREQPVRVVTIGDVMLDVLVEAPDGLVPDDDVPARITFAAGGQAANVAAWARDLGADATVVGPRATTGPGRLVTDALTALGVRLVGPEDASAGAVLSLVSAGSRAMASDPGDPSWVDRLSPGDWLDGAAWLFVSGYALLRSRDPAALRDVAARARDGGAGVAVDLASAGMILAHDPARFRDTWQSLEPAVVLATDAEWAATHAGAVPPRTGGFGTGGRTVLVLKHGAGGATFVVDGVEDHRPPVAGPVVDVTGAGDALAAGFLVGGVDLAMAAASRCVATLGAQPATEDSATGHSATGHSATEEPA